MALRDEIIPAGDLEARLAALGGWHGDTSGIRKDYRIGYDDAILAVAEIGRAVCGDRRRRCRFIRGNSGSGPRCPVLAPRGAGATAGK